MALPECPSTRSPLNWRFADCTFTQKNTGNGGGARAAGRPKSNGVAGFLATGSAAASRIEEEDAADVTFQILGLTTLRFSFFQCNARGAGCAHGRTPTEFDVAHCDAQHTGQYRGASHIRRRLNARFPSNNSHEGIRCRTVPSAARCSHSSLSAYRRGVE